MIDFGHAIDVGGLGTLFAAAAYWTRAQMLKEFRKLKELHNVTPVVTSQITPERIEQLEERVDGLKDRINGVERRVSDRLEDFSGKIRDLRRGHA